MQKEITGYIKINLNILKNLVESSFISQGTVFLADRNQCEYCRVFTILTLTFLISMLIKLNILTLLEGVENLMVP